METIKNVTQLFVLKKQTPTVGLEGDTIDGIEDLLDGEVAVVDYRNVVQDGANGGASLTAGLNKIKLIGRSGDKLIHSDWIGKGTVTGYTVTPQSAEVQQIDYVGYAGTGSASLGALTSTLHTIRLYVRDSTTAGFMQQKIKEGFYKSGASTSQAAIALGLVRSLVANYSREPEQDLTFDRVNNATQVALGTSVGTVTLTKGSKYFTASDIDDATGGGTALAAGDYLCLPRGNARQIDLTGTSGTMTIVTRGISTTATFNASLTQTAIDYVSTQYDALLAVGIVVTNPSVALLTFTTIDGSAIYSITPAAATGDMDGTEKELCTGATPVYAIAALDATNDIGTLDTEYQGDSIVWDDLELMQLESASIAASVFGIKVSAFDRKFVAGKFASLPMTFKTTIDFGTSSSTTVTESTAAAPGQGTAQQIQHLEKELQADEYVYRSFVEGAPVDRTQAEKYKLYDVCSITFSGQIQSGLGTVVNSPKTILIAIEGTSNLSASDANQGVVQTLDETFQLWAEVGYSEQDGNLS